MLIMMMIVIVMMMHRQLGKSNIESRDRIDVLLRRSCQNRVVGAGHPGRDFVHVKLIDMRWQSNGVMILFLK